jgi:RNA polymerase sigma factor (TIGR02999 family)
VEKGFCFKVYGLYSAGNPYQVGMPDNSSHQITLLLHEWNKGDDNALEQLMPLVYEELRRMARGYLRHQAPNHTFQTSELIHEAYLKIEKVDGRDWQNRAHFFGVAAKAMRHILVDYARAKNSGKRGWQNRVSLGAATAISSDRSSELIALDDALTTLQSLDERKSRVVELRFFGGLTNEEMAEVLQISTETVKRDWRFARTWLLRELAATS